MVQSTGTVTSDRRSEDRPQSPPRRRARRPALWLNLVVLVLGIAIVLFALEHRRRLDATFARIVRTQVSSPYQVAKMRSELSSMELTRAALDREIRNRLAMTTAFEAAEFYVAIDTAQRKLRLHFGPEIVREADVMVGDSRVVKADGRSWQFVALKGALTVTGKVVDAPWEVPPWAWAMRNEPVPAVPVTVSGGLGKYVILLPNGYVVHSPPAAGSPLQGVKPGSFMVAEEEMRAIWPRISTATRVYIY